MTNKITLIFILISLICNISLSGETKPLESWKDQILYFIMTDRFYDSSNNNNKEINKSDIYSFHGGDFNGIKQKIPYLKKLGITGIWLSPVFKNRPGSFFKHFAYHGYWTWNFWETDERFGSFQELKELRQSLANNHIKLLLDMVVNHMGYDAPFVDSHKEWFHHTKNIKNWHDKKQLEQCKIFGLPDFASEKPVVKRFFKKVGKYWIDKLSPDGFRLDAVKHVPIVFWNYFNTAIKKYAGNNFFLLGEDLNGDPKEISKTLKAGKFTSLFDYPMYYTIKDVFAGGQNCKKLGARFYADAKYKDAGLLATFIDNHDLDRFITTCSNNVKKYKLALAFLLTIRGIPTLCYGDEAGLKGKESPKPMNRRDMVFDESSDIFKYVKKLIKIRKSNVALRRGLQCHLGMTDRTYSFARLSNNQVAAILINNDSKPREFNIKCEFDFRKQILKDSLNSNNGIYRDGRIISFLPAKSCSIYLSDISKNYYSSILKKWKLRAEKELAWGTKKVTFKIISSKIPDTAKVYLIGSLNCLGNWDVNSNKVTHLIKNKNGEYQATVNMPLGAIFECKYFYKLNKKKFWAKGDNHIGEVTKNGSEYFFIK